MDDLWVDANGHPLLGVVLAGGRSRRFGSDKALARLGERTLLDAACAALARWCGRVIIVGRSEPADRAIADWPRAGMGPLGGLAAGLRFGRSAGYDAILSCGVDSVGLPGDLPDRLSPAPAFLVGQPVIGLWPVSAADCIEAILRGDGRHSVYHFAEAIGARAVAIEPAPANINHPDDLDALNRGEAKQK